MGFNHKATTPENAPKDYYPKLRLIGDTLFVCSNSGIYQKDLKQGCDWQLYGFENIPITEFVKEENKLLAISSRSQSKQDSLLLLSEDYGKTYADYTSFFFFRYNNYNHFYRINQNPENPNSLLILDLFNGLSKSDDFGENWVNLHPYSLGQHWTFTSYHPLDTISIFHSAENDFFNGIIYNSYDAGNNWSEYRVPGGDNCVHQIAFHPNNANILVFGGEGIIGKSIDKGETWKIIDIIDDGMYFYSILFDKNNPHIIYASGSRSTSENNNFIFVYRSMNTGDTWQLAYKEELEMDYGEMIDMVQYKNKLIFYTRDCGLFELDLETIPLSSNLLVEKTSELTIYPNPVHNTIHFETDAIISQVDIVDMMGRLIQRTNIVKQEKVIDVSCLNAGIYLAVFYFADKGKITTKIQITR